MDETGSFSFFECNKDLKTETLAPGNTFDVSEEAAAAAATLDLEEEEEAEAEEEEEYIAMKREFEEPAQRMEKWAAHNSSHGVEHGFHGDNNKPRGGGGESLYLESHLVIPMKHSEATCIRFSRDHNDLLAVGTTAGTVEVYNARSGRCLYKLDVGRKGIRKWTCTSMSFRPSKFAKVAENVLVSCDVAGRIHHWHATSEKHLAMSSEPENEIFAVDHDFTGQKFATSGCDFKVRIYDGITRQLIQTFDKGNDVTTAGHTNRVFAIKWHPSDINITLSGGWDNTIQVWDARIGTSIRSIYGVQIYGDALDINEENNHVLTGSWRRTNQLQEWDFGSAKLLENIPWPQGNGNIEPCRLYAATYGTKLSQNLIVAGGSGTNEACLFSIDSKEVLGKISTNDKGVYGIDFSCDGTQLAVLTPTAIYLNSINKSLHNNINTK